MIKALAALFDRLAEVASRRAGLIGVLLVVAWLLPWIERAIELTPLWLLVAGVIAVATALALVLTLFLALVALHLAVSCEDYSMQ